MFFLYIRYRRTIFGEDSRRFFVRKSTVQIRTRRRSSVQCVMFRISKKPTTTTGDGRELLHSTVCNAK